MSLCSLNFVRFLFIGLMAYGWSAQAEYTGPEVPYVENLELLADQSHQGQMPIVMIVTQSDCSYCELLKEEIIQPVLLSRDYDGRAIFCELVMDDQDSIVGFDGKKRNAGDLARDYNIWVTPTVLYLDSHGKEIAERALGINTVDYYGYYMDEEIKKALKKLREL